MGRIFKVDRYDLLSNISTRESHLSDAVLAECNIAALRAHVKGDSAQKDSEGSPWPTSSPHCQNKDVPRISVGSEVQAAKLIERVAPEYPPLARQAHAQGTVVLRIMVRLNT